MNQKWICDIDECVPYLFDDEWVCECVRVTTNNIRYHVFNEIAISAIYIRCELN